MKRLLNKLAFLALALSAASAAGQGYASEQAVGRFAVLRGTPGGSAHRTRGDTLKFVFRERYVGSGTLTYAVYDSARALSFSQADFPLAKRSGLNLFALPLGGLLGAEADYARYCLIVRDERGRKLYLPFRYEAREFEASLFEPIVVEACEGANEHDIYFTAEFSGGTAPYSAAWRLEDRLSGLVLEEAQAFDGSFEASVRAAGPSPSVDYLVTVTVRDACGNEATAALSIVCAADGSGSSFTLSPAFEEAGAGTD